MPIYNVCMQEILMIIIIWTDSNELWLPLVSSKCNMTILKMKLPCSHHTDRGVFKEIAREYSLRIFFESILQRVYLQTNYFTCKIMSWMKWYDRS